jgi:hypothetical protein
MNNVHSLSLNYLFVKTIQNHEMYFTKQML